VSLSAAAADSAEDAFDDDFVSLGGLKGNQGNRNYELPASLALSRYNSVVIWCQRLSIGLAVAPVT
jgi:hypothetical protein